MKLFQVLLNVTPQVVNTCSGDHRIEGKYLVTVMAENAADALYALTYGKGDELAIIRIAKQADYAVQQ
jgi:hypothetical protein